MEGVPSREIFTMNPDHTPTLQPPGAGLPWIEKVVARHIVFPLTCLRMTWASAADRFQSEGAKILSIWDRVPANLLTQRVLIKRFPGIEDSSRYWSLAMTVEHLNIVGPALQGVIASLRQGKTPAGAARVEDVKPKGELEPAKIRADFVQLLSVAAQFAANDPPIPRGQGPRFPHPWFGPIDGFQWHCMLGMHQGIHRRQAEAIVRGLV